MQQYATAPLVLPNGTADQYAAIQAGRRIGVDGLLIVDVKFLESDGSLYDTKTIRIGDPEVMAAVQYELIDVRSGQILDSNVINSQSYKGDLSPLPPSLSAESKVLSQLAYSGGVKVAGVFLPHEDQIKVKLAHSTLGPGSSDSRKGVAAAQADNWAEARKHWLTAVEANPKNYAAMYNLALAHEALGEFMLARRALESANGSPNSDTKEALARVDRAAAEMRLAQRPISAPFVRAWRPVSQSSQP